MRLNLSRKQIFVLSIVFIFIVLFQTSIAGKKQDKGLLSDYNLFIEAEALLNQESYDQALANYYTLVKSDRNQDSVSILWGISQALKHSGDLEGTKFYLEKIQKVFPAIVYRSEFLQEYGELLLQLGDERGRLYLGKSSEVTN